MTHAKHSLLQSVCIVWVNFLLTY